MKASYRNIFFGIGILAIILMLCTSDISYTELWQNIRQAGYWFPAVVGLWVIIYAFNAKAWSQILNDGDKPAVPYRLIYKFTVSGYALNYVTPVGLLGGEPYRIMELTPYVGASKATSSVILYAMMHIFSHFCFWFFSILLYILLYGSSMPPGMLVFIIICTIFCIAGIYFFMLGYKYGLAMKSLSALSHLPWFGIKIRNFAQHHQESIRKVDTQIAELHARRKSTFYMALTLEFGARVLGCLELQLILLILTDHVTFANCILIQAFTSLFANLFFFMPMSIGAREGGFAIAVGGLTIAPAYGVYMGLLTRVRELIWIAIGLLLIKVGNRNQTV